MPGQLDNASSWLPAAAVSSVSSWFQVCGQFVTSLHGTTRWCAKPYSDAAPDHGSASFGKSCTRLRRSPQSLHQRQDWGNRWPTFTLHACIVSWHARSARGLRLEEGVSLRTPDGKDPRIWGHRHQDQCPSPDALGGRFGESLRTSVRRSPPRKACWRPRTQT